MFGTLLGPLPRPPLPDTATPAELLATVVRAQEAAGLEPITDAGFGVGDDAVTRWVATAARTDRPVKAVLEGPYSSGVAAEAIRAQLLALAAAGCLLVEIHEPAAVDIGADEAKRAAFRAAHLRLLDGVTGLHCSLAVTGGDAAAAGVETLLAAPYASLALDLIAGPENWRLVVATPQERGVICGAIAATPGTDDRVEILLWAAGYAASTASRGPARVGIATASSFAGLTWDEANRKLDILGRAARLADQPAGDVRRRLDPRAIDSRSAALGRYAPRPARRRVDRPPDRA
jgi:hypothetical protein